MQPKGRGKQAPLGAAQSPDRPPAALTDLAARTRRRHEADPGGGTRAAGRRGASSAGLQRACRRPPEHGAGMPEPLRSRSGHFLATSDLPLAPAAWRRSLALYRPLLPPTVAPRLCCRTQEDAEHGFLRKVRAPGRGSLHMRRPSRRLRCRPPLPCVSFSPTAAAPSLIHSAGCLPHGARMQAYYKLSREWHPDKVGPERQEEATVMFQRINAAYQASGRQQPAERAGLGGAPQRAAASPALSWRPPCFMPLSACA